VAGLSLAAFVIPESLAYASLAQLPPVTGLYCYLVAGITYALFGTSRQREALRRGHDGLQGQDRTRFRSHSCEVAESRTTKTILPIDRQARD
jgi:hypothetical protein